MNVASILGSKIQSISRVSPRKLPQLRTRSNVQRQLAAMATPESKDTVAKEENYNGRWENLWGQGLQPGQFFDAGCSSPSLDTLLASGKLGDLQAKRVMVPGCGRGYDVVTFVKAGAAEAVGLELAPSSIPPAQAYVNEQLGPLSCRARVVQGDFFAWQDPQETGFDIGMDYTFLCALHPTMREDWGKTWKGLLVPGANLVTLIFPVDRDGPFTGPPWPVTPELYTELLEPHGFVLRSLEKLDAGQSHPGREGREYLAVWQRT